MFVVRALLGVFALVTDLGEFIVDLAGKLRRESSVAA
jgi:hypothetical protein